MVRIAIIGAGPSGLTLASLLNKSCPSISYTVFDLRPSPTSARSPTSPSLPSGSLDLHAESGLLALQECGLYDAFESLKREGSEETILADKHGEVKWQDNGMGGNRPEIARNDLLQLLTSSIPSENIKWEHKLFSITTSPESPSRTLHFVGNQSYEFDFVIGADGAWSRIRPLITAIKPYFSGINCITLTIPQISQHPSLSALIGLGSFYASGDHKAVIAQRGSLDSARVYLMIQSSTPDYLSTSGISSATPQQLEHILLAADESLFSAWSPTIKNLITTGLTSSIAPTCAPLSMLPPTHTFSHTSGLTVLGDAAHLMTPFAGEGVNAAMLDALELFRAISSSMSPSPFPNAKSLDTHIQMFEEAMFARMAPIAEETLANLNVIFAADAPDGFVKVMQSHGPPDEE